jgi:hypothetical protein
MEAEVRLVHCDIREARERDNRSRVPFDIAGPSAEVRLRVGGDIVELVVPPLELVELRARLNEPQFFRRTAEETAVAVALADLALQGKPERRRLVSPHAVRSDGDWARRFEQASELLNAREVTAVIAEAPAWVGRP